MINRKYPLLWPADQARTPAHLQRGSSPFQVTPDKAMRDLYAELKRFNATGVILSSNVPVRADGGIYADVARRRIDDAGVALYFDIGARKISICCDLYQRPDDNIRALFKIIEAMRTIERYGGQALSDKAFTGFAALPPPLDIWKVCSASARVSARLLSPKMRREFVMDAFRSKAKEGHGAGADMAALSEARDEALRQLGVGSDA